MLQLQLDPVNARSHAGLADFYNMFVFYGFSRDLEAKRKATLAAEKALALDNSLPEAHAALAYCNLFWWWHWEDAERGFLRALELNKNYLPAHHWYALYLTVMGRQEQSIEEIQKAKELDPLSPAVQAAAGYISYFAGHFAQSIRECNSALEISSNSMAAYYVRGLSYEASGQYSLAASDFQKAFQLSGQQTEAYEAALGHVYAVAGRRQEAQSILGNLEKGEKNGVVLAVHKATIWTALGEKQKAIALLQ